MIKIKKKMDLTNLSIRIQKIFKKAIVIESFLNEKHIEFILINQEKKEILIWLPESLGTCVKFPLPMNSDKFILEFSDLPVKCRLSYIVENFIETQFKDLNRDISMQLQLTINRKTNELYQKRIN